MMIETLKDRIEKAEEKLEKKNDTLQKKFNLIEKKKVKLNKAGFAYTEEGKAAVTELYRKGQGKYFWLFSDIRDLESDIIRIQKEIVEISQKLENYKQNEKELQQEVDLIKELPVELKQMQEELVEKWDKWDIERRDSINQDYKILGYKDFCKKYNRYDFEFRYKTDEQIHKSNLKDAQDLIINLIYRVKDIVGTITNWDSVHVASGAYGPVLNGYVEGTEGRASVESIIAGGPVQRLHMRTLVKEYK